MTDTHDTELPAAVTHDRWSPVGSVRFDGYRVGDWLVITTCGIEVVAAAGGGGRLALEVTRTGAAGPQLWR